MGGKRWWLPWLSRRTVKSSWSIFRWFLSSGVEKNCRKTSSGVIELSLLVFGGFALLAQTVLFQELMNHRTTQHALQQKVAVDYQLEGVLTEARFLLRTLEEHGPGLTMPSVFFPELTIEIDRVIKRVFIKRNNRPLLEAYFTGHGNSVKIVEIVSLSNRPYSR